MMEPDEIQTPELEDRVRSTVFTTFTGAYSAGRCGTVLDLRYKTRIKYLDIEDSHVDLCPLAPLLRASCSSII